MFVFTSTVLAQQSAERSFLIAQRAEYEKSTALWKAKGDAAEALHKAEQSARNAKGKEARKEARKALAYAQWISDTTNSPKFQV